jgi:hypothetical protein
MTWGSRDILKFILCLDWGMYNRNDRDEFKTAVVVPEYLSTVTLVTVRPGVTLALSSFSADPTIPTHHQAQWT